jgi:DNA repair exonuclease SbcCD ATPase subunit
VLSSEGLAAMPSRSVRGSVLEYGHGMEPGFPLPHHVHRHVRAARAFHTDLIAHAQRRLRVLINVAKHLNVLRSRNSSLAEKLSAAESSRTHLETLEQLRRSSRETYSDFKNAVRRIHHHLKRLATGKARREELAVWNVERAACADRRRRPHVKTRLGGEFK